MSRISAEELRRTTLARQFPRIDTRDADGVLALFEHLGPIQSQVPRAPFITVSARLPGISYQTVRDLFADHRLLKTTSIRGTVHTSVRADFVRLDAVCRKARLPLLRRALKLGSVEPAAVVAEVECYTRDDWRSRDEIVAHLTRWLAERGSRFDANTFTGNLFWGHSGLIRRPKDTHWEKRTDIFHRTAAEVVRLPPLPDPTDALADLVRVHLRSYGPLGRADLAFFFGVGLGQIDTALTALADQVVQLIGPDSETLLDLAEPATDGDPEPGLRLLPEYDGLLVGYAGPNRTRFCSEDQLARVWAKVNGVFSPVVLADGRLVATWKTVADRTRTLLEVTMLPGESVLGEDAFADQLAALGRVLALDIGMVRVLPSR
jgi:hypothetical protein